MSLLYRLSGERRKNTQRKVMFVITHREKRINQKLLSDDERYSFVNLQGHSSRYYLENVRSSLETTNKLPQKRGIQWFLLVFISICTKNYMDSSLQSIRTMSMQNKIWNLTSNDNKNPVKKRGECLMMVVVYLSKGILWFFFP